MRILKISFSGFLMVEDDLSNAMSFAKGLNRLGKINFV